MGSQLVGKAGAEVSTMKLSFEFNKTFKHIPPGRGEALGSGMLLIFKVKHKFEHPDEAVLWMRVKGRIPEQAFPTQR